MSEKILFLTGRLAQRQLNRVLDSLQPADFLYKTQQIGISVAALMTPKLIRRRVSEAGDADRILVPGRCRGDLDELSRHYHVPVERGPDDLKDLPAFFGRSGPAPDLSRHDCLIFAEIVETPHLPVEEILAQAASYAAAGANVIDLGCLPDTEFPHLEDAVYALQTEGFKVSVDSADVEELSRAGRAGADYLLSLSEETLHLVDEVDSIPVLIPAKPGDMDSLYRAIDAMTARGKPFLADPILNPIHFGFTDSLVRYRDLRQRYPEVEILMGVGNLTELTGADTTGITALLMGVVSELRIGAVLVVRVSPHCRRAVHEADLARRIMFAAREENSLPVGIDDGLMGLHDRRPTPYSPGEIAELAALVQDPSFRIQVSEAGLHVFNRDGHHIGDEPFALFPKLGVEADGPHAFYLGVELARAHIAHRLGKVYTQDQELDWGCSAEPGPTEDEGEATAPGHTLALAAERRAAEKRAAKKRPTKKYTAKKRKEQDATGKAAKKAPKKANAKAPKKIMGKTRKKKK